MRTFAIVALVLRLAHSAFGQPNPGGPEFEVVVIKPNKSGDPQMPANMLPSGQFAVKNMPVTQLLLMAFDVHDNSIMNRPGWMDSDRFDLTGRAAPNVKDEALKLMLQNLLAKELKLVYHKEEKPMSVFALIIGKGGPKLQDAAEKGEPRCKRVGGPIVDGQAHLACTSMKMSDLVQTLPRIAPAYIDRPVVDLTELTGTYDFKLDWVGAGFIDQGGLTMPDAVARLGLKLEERKLPTQVLVLDHIEKPSDNN
jgi:uncharacterized protein (TIGR03435 family)